MASIPNVTVCIPAYNRPDVLREALASVCDQGLDRNEYVVVVSDDASPTDLSTVVSEFEPRIRIVYHRGDRNIGHIANFARAVSMVDTPYLSFLPHDDLMAPGQLGRALRAIVQEPGTVLVASLVLCQPHPGALNTRPHGAFLRGAARANYLSPYVWEPAEWMALGLATTPLSMVGSLFSASAFRQCRHWTQYPLWHDRLMMAEMGLHGRVISLPWIGGYYRTGDGQLSSELWQPDLREFRDTSELILRLCDTARIPVIEFWIDQICEAAPLDRITYLQMLSRSLGADRFISIKQACERRLGRRLPLDRLERLGVPKPVATAVKAFERFVNSRRG